MNIKKISQGQFYSLIIIHNCNARLSLELLKETSKYALHFSLFVGNAELLLFNTVFLFAFQAKSIVRHISNTTAVLQIMINVLIVNLFNYATLHPRIFIFLVNPFLLNTGNYNCIESRSLAGQVPQFKSLKSLKITVKKKH